MTFYLQLGRLTDLSLLELENLLPDHTFSPVTLDIVSVEAEAEYLLTKINQSGGVIKVLEHIETLTKPDKETLVTQITAYLAQKKRPTFSIHEIQRPNQQLIISTQTIKNRLKEHGVSSRFIDSSEDGLSAAVLLHQKVDEISVMYLENETILARTIWVQDIDSWTKRDRVKPKRDPKRGMLPPKLARMMVNYVSPDVQARPNKRLYDPFCGSGTVLMEAILCDWKALGSDLSPEAVHDTAANMHWFVKAYEKPELAALFIADATNVKLAQIGQKVDAIVTEPFLGKPTPNPKDLPNIFKGLEKMYLGALKHWTKILTEGGEVIIVTPLVIDRKTTYSLESIIDKSKAFGYNVVSGPHMYHRPQTIVQRAIYKLKYLE